MVLKWSCCNVQRTVSGVTFNPPSAMQSCIECCDHYLLDLRSWDLRQSWTTSCRDRDLNSASEPSASQLPNPGTLSHSLSAKPATPIPSNADSRHSYFVNHTAYRYPVISSHLWAQTVTATGHARRAIAYRYPVISSQTDTPCVNHGLFVYFIICILSV